jgi:hypothetical protein
MSRKLLILQQRIKPKLVEYSWCSVRCLCCFARDWMKYWLTYSRFRSTPKNLFSIQVEYFWVVTPSSFVIWHQRFRGSCCLHPQGEDGSNNVPRNVSILPQHYTASQPRKPRLESLPPWKPQISPKGPLNRRRCYVDVFTLKMRQQGSPKRWYPITALHGVTTQNTST